MTRGMLGAVSAGKTFQTMSLKLSRLLMMLGALATTTAGADIRETPHALVKSKKKDGSDLCVFCHTPNVTAGTPQ